MRELKRLDTVLREWGIVPGELPDEDEDELPEFGGEDEEGDEDWAGEFDDDDPYGDEEGA